MAQSCIWIVLLPFIAFLIQVFLGKKLPRQGDWVCILGILGSFLLSVPIFGKLLMTGVLNEDISTTWISLPSPSGTPLRLVVGILVNHFTAIMLFMVTLCAFLIHLFSSGYMHGEERYHLFFAYISLFTAAMLGLVVSDNLLTFFIFWELMGLCSYLLIGFYYKKPSANHASLKAFMTTRIGDVGLFLGICGIFSIFETTQFSTIYQTLLAGGLEGKTILGIPALTFIGFMILMGAVGKSAQFPLQVWLPDAMEGPTPVSALIHAATMVAAGVFLLIRMFPLLHAANILIYVAYIGGTTAFLAACLAVVQIDIKKVLAYSTISQLGYMVLGVGVGAFGASLLHLITHACFKACLFLGSGSVIHSVHTQDMEEMGGLRKKMPITFLTMLVSTLAISGLPFFSGFVSKDRILASVLEHNMMYPIHILLPLFGFSAAALTAFYMFRMIYMTFFGPARDEHKFHHAHEQPFVMTFPLCVLAILSLSLWYAGPTGLHSVDHAVSVHWFDNAVDHVSKEWQLSQHRASEEIQERAHSLALFLSLLVAMGGIFLSTMVYLKEWISATRLKQAFLPIHTVLWNRYYMDSLYLKVIVQGILLNWNRFLARFDDLVIDRGLVDGWGYITMVVKSFIGRFDDIVIDRLGVDGAGTVTLASGWVLRLFQTGKVQQYVLLSTIFLGLLLLLLK